MKSHFLSRFDSENLIKTIIYLIFSIVLIGVSLLAGLTDNIITLSILFIGMISFFFNVLRLWGKVSYYAIMGGIFLVLFMFLLLKGINLLVQMQLKGHLAEDIAWFVGFVCVSGIIAGIIGMICFKNHN
jgi:hypothetical protein